MKKFVALVMVCLMAVSSNAFSATRASRGNAVTRPGATGTVSATKQPVSGANNSGASTSARAAAVRRSGTSNVATGVKTNVASVDVAPTKRVNARAATTQKAINSGTKISGATANTVISEECKEKYYGCMDSFCMLDNANGGRCLCSNRNAELDKVLDEIQKLDEQSYAMATSGVERINMGMDADAVDAMVNKITNKETDKPKARSLNLDAWNDFTETEEEEENIFGTTGVSDGISDKTGDELHAVVSDMCAKQIPECSANVSMLKMMYSQQIKSDCNAYENSLKKQKNESTKKLQTAQSALREAALEQHQNANKYDLGQCTVRFKQCMQTTADCGEDFSKCASVIGTSNAQTKVGKKNQTKDYTIQGEMTSITIAASTYDTLVSKKPMCESVTKQCVKVQDKVWDTFLREVAPELKAAELLAESNVRMNCIANISNCFQKACKDNIDPNDPDGSYDLCLSRPDTIRSLCKVQIDPCIAAEPKILDYVYARIASIRVDACTTEVKSCLTDDNRCGKDYSNCIGLDTDTIINMCPSDKLTACNTDANGNKLSQDKVYDNIEIIISGLLLNIDNALLAQCQNALNQAMINVCGDANECIAFDEDKNIGADSLSSYKNADGDFVIEGLLSFGQIKMKETINDDDSGDLKFSKYELDLDDYKNVINGSTNEAAKTRVLSSIQSIQNKINQKISLIASDTKVDMCINGRDMSRIRRGNQKQEQDKAVARFPNLLASVTTNIINAGLTKAEKNYNSKFDDMLSEVTKESDEEKKAALCYSMASVSGGSTAALLASKATSIDSVSMIIGGFSTDDLINNSKGDYIGVNADGNMIKRKTVSAVYSKADNKCKVSTQISRCNNYYNDNYDYVKADNNKVSTQISRGNNYYNGNYGYVKADNNKVSTQISRGNNYYNGNYGYVFAALFDEVESWLAADAFDGKKCDKGLVETETSTNEIPM